MSNQNELDTVPELESVDDHPEIVNEEDISSEEEIEDCPCINPDWIDDMAMCTFIYDPVIGCDGNEYSNSCLAEAAGITINLQTYEDFDIVTDNFISGACDVVTTDGSALVGRKAQQQPEGEEWVIFPGAPISKEPLGPTYGQNDSTWADVINWTVYATIIASEKGIDSGNAASVVGNEAFDAEAQRLMGGEGELQTLMGLNADAFQQVITQVGNYDEIFNNITRTIVFRNLANPVTRD